MHAPCARKLRNHRSTLCFHFSLLIARSDRKPHAPRHRHGCFFRNLRRARDLIADLSHRHKARVEPAQRGLGCPISDNARSVREIEIDMQRIVSA